MICNVNYIEKLKDKRAVVLQSGGLDSCYVACLLSRLGFEMHHLFIDYGQNSVEQEFEAATNISNEYGGFLHTVSIDMPWLESATKLSGHKVDAPSVQKELGCVRGGTYVPMRNHIFLSIASSLAETLGIKYIACGLDGKEDFWGRPITGSPDKHPTFVRAIENSLTEGSAQKHFYHSYFELITPIIYGSKEKTIEEGRKIGCNFDLSWTCYNGDTEEPCGECSACIDRQEHFNNVDNN